MERRALNWLTFYLPLTGQNVFIHWSSHGRRSGWIRPEDSSRKGESDRSPRSSHYRSIICYHRICSIKGKVIPRFVFLEKQLLRHVMSLKSLHICFELTLRQNNFISRSKIWSWSISDVVSGLQINVNKMKKLSKYIAKSISIITACFIHRACSVCSFNCRRCPVHDDLGLQSRRRKPEGNPSRRLSLTRSPRSCPWTRCRLYRLLVGRTWTLLFSWWPCLDYSLLYAETMQLVAFLTYLTHLSEIFTFSYLYFCI